MIRHLLTGQVARALRSVCLPTLCFLIVPASLAGQSVEVSQPPLSAKTVGVPPKGKATAAAPAATAAPAARTATKVGIAAKDNDSAAANPAPEPNTLLLLGTGIVVLSLLYTRRRGRLVSPRAQPQQ